MITNFWFLWMFLIGFLIYLTISVFIAYHLVRFGYLNAPTRRMMMTHVLVTLAVIVGIVAYGWNVDWEAGVEITNPLPELNEGDIVL